MLAQLKHILLQQYIGAIVTAFMAAQALLSLVSVVMMPITHYLLAAQRPTSVSMDDLTSQRPDWTGVIVGLITAALHLGIVAALIRWLYYPRTTDVKDGELPAGA